MRCSRRGVAQPGRALRSGRRSRRFKSCLPDQESRRRPPFWGGLLCFPFSRFAGEGARRADEGAFALQKRKAGPHPNPLPQAGEGANRERPGRLVGSPERPRPEPDLIKPRTPPGVMELLPRDQIAFQRMLDAIRRNYERFGFLPAETPAMELSEVLLTKSGGETERQVYFVQSTGALEKAGEGMPELALRFDLTVPLARYVAEHEHDLAFPFRRYQMQRVYRGERAQRGRFREFYQCDIDVVGKDSLSTRFDAEIPAVIHAVFSELAIGRFTIQLNNRKLMRGFFEAQGVVDPDLQARVLREVDKLDKRGADYVRETLAGEGFGLSPESVAAILAFVGIRSTSHADALARLDPLDPSNRALQAGAAEP